MTVNNNTSVQQPLDGSQTQGAQPGAVPPENGSVQPPANQAGGANNAGNAPDAQPGGTQNQGQNGSGQGAPTGGNTGQTTLQGDQAAGDALDMMAQAGAMAGEAGNALSTPSTTLPPPPPADSTREQLMNQAYQNAGQAMQDGNAALFDEAVNQLAQDAAPVAAEAAPDPSSERKAKEDRKSKDKKENKAEVQRDVQEDAVTLTLEERQHRAQLMQQLTTTYAARKAQQAELRQEQFFSALQRNQEGTVEVESRMQETLQADQQAVTDGQHEQAAGVKKKFSLFQGYQPRQAAKKEGPDAKPEAKPEAKPDAEGAEREALNDEDYARMTYEHNGGSEVQLDSPERAQMLADMKRARTAARTSGGLDVEGGDTPDATAAETTRGSENEVAQDGPGDAAKPGADGKPAATARPGAPAGAPALAASAPLHEPTPAELATCMARAAGERQATVMVNGGRAACTAGAGDGEITLRENLTGETEDGESIDPADQRYGLLSQWQNLGAKRYGEGPRPVRERLKREAQQEEGEGALAAAGVSGTGGANQGTTTAQRKPTFTTGEGYTFDLLPTEDPQNPNGVDEDAVRYNAQRSGEAMALLRTQPRGESAVMNPGNVSIEQRYNDLRQRGWETRVVTLANVGTRV